MKKPPKRLNDLDALLNYGAWYLGRYSASKKKLEGQLAKRTDNEGLVPLAMEKLLPYVDDKREIENIIAYNWKLSLSSLKWKLIQKWFSASDIDEVLSMQWEESSNAVRIQNYLPDLERVKDEKEKKKLFDKLLRKGFRYSEVRKFFDVEE